jgi:hypothetical protein
MAGYREPDFKERQKVGVAAKKATLEKHRMASDDPLLKERQAARVQVQEARAVRAADRAAAKMAREAQEAEDASRALDAERAVEAQKAEAAALVVAQEVEKQAALQAEQKAARDARYAARKAAKKVRRRGY